MGQREVYDYLKARRLRSDAWMSIKDVRAGMKKKGFTCNKAFDDLIRLALFKMIQCKGQGLWNHRKLFRAFKVNKK